MSQLLWLIFSVSVIIHHKNMGLLISLLCIWFNILDVRIFPHVYSPDQKVGQILEKNKPESLEEKSTAEGGKKVCSLHTSGAECVSSQERLLERRSVSSQLLSLRILAVAAPPPGSPSVIVMDSHPFLLLCLNKLNGAQTEKYCAPSNVKLCKTDYLETRSGFITRRLQCVRPLLSLGIWRNCPYAPLTPTTPFLFLRWGT